MSYGAGFVGLCCLGVGILRWLRVLILVGLGCNGVWCSYLGLGFRRRLHLLVLVCVFGFDLRVCFFRRVGVYLGLWGCGIIC